jgi:hypothetical protein
MSFAILRIQKHKTIAAIAGVARHHSREIDCPTADPKKSPNNLKLGLAASGSKEVGRGIKAIIDDAQSKVKRKFRSDSVKAVEFMLTASPEFFTTANKKQKNQFFKKSIDFLEKEFGKQNIVATWLHLDESTPHLHVMMVPIDSKGVLNARHFFGSADKLSELQTKYAEVVSSLGLERGVKGSKAKHQPVKAFWQRVFAEPAPAPLTKNDLLKASMGFKVDAVEKLQEQATQFSRLKKATANIFARNLTLSRRQKDIEIDANSLRIKQEMFAKDSYEIEKLQKENRFLKERVAVLDKSVNSPGRSLESLGL